MGAYETWLRTKQLLAEESVTDEQDGYYEAVLIALQPEALQDYLEQFVGEHAMYAEEVAVSANDVPAFLAGLDELRAPSSKELAETKRELFREIGKALDWLRKSNWTGDHLYGDALDDMAQVVVAIENGAPFPKLERFRCPSIYKHTAVRCQLQLPHQGDHHYEDSAGRGVTWTDEQSVNPPKPYDEPSEGV